jgi:ComF family protein
VHALKYDGRRALSRALARLMIERGEEVLEGAVAAVPVPLAPARLLSRGFNQADDLAGETGLPVRRLLRRRGFRSRPQAGLGAAERLRNVDGAFALRQSARHLRSAAGDWHGGTVVLVDDVMTTGATLDSCASVLLDAGVRSVRALTLARASARRPQPPLD